MSRRRPTGSAGTSYAYVSITSAGAQLPSLGTPQFFPPGDQTGTTSPIDQFISNCNEINVSALSAYIDGRTALPRELGSLVILGYMSAVESYFRAMIAGVIFVDEFASFISEGKTLVFGAALHHTPKKLPEALLETISFASQQAVRDALKDFLRVRPEKLASLKAAFDAYDKICEIRHCCVHRFGKLGSKNAIRLGFTAYRDILERPFSVDIGQLQDLALSLRIFIKSVNAIVFQEVLEKTIRAVPDSAYAFSYPRGWTWKWPSDRKRFLAYYDLFATTVDTSPSAEAKLIYDSFREFARANA